MTNDLSKRQYDLECKMLQMGVDRYRNLKAKAEVGGNETSLPPVIHLLKGSIEPVAEGIREFMASNEKRRGRKHIACKRLRDMAPDVVAFIGCRIILDKISGNKTGEAAIAISIGRAIEDEFRFAKFEAEKPGYFYTLKENVTEHSRHRRGVFKGTMQKLSVSWENWPKHDHLHVGSLILRLFRERTGLIERRIERRNARTKKVLRATEEVLNYLSDRHARAELMSPQYLPMLVKPRPWTGMFEGGYLTPGRQLCMVRGKGVNRNAIEEIQNRFDDFPMLLQALNAVQETPWQVNRDVRTAAQ